MKLYYSPGASSLSPHIAPLEAGLPDAAKVDVRAKEPENGDDCLKADPEGQVPAPTLDNGEVITEGPLIGQLPNASGFPKMTPGEIEQAKHTASWLNSLATAISTAGAVAPFVAYIAGSLPGTARIGALGVIGIICFAIAFILHLVGRKILAEI